MGFIPVEVEERILEDEIMKEPDAVEKGLIVLDHQVPAGRGRIDILAVDSAGTFAILELKVKEDDSMLIQALAYYDWVYQNIDRLAEWYKKKNPEVNIDKERQPRIILVAPTFSQWLKMAAKYVDVDIDLIEVVYLQSRGGERGLYCRAVELEPRAGPPRRPPEVTDHVDYIKDLAVRQLCNEVIQEIQKLGSDIEVKPTAYAISFKHANRVIASIYTRKNFFWIQYPPKSGEEWLWKRVKEKADFTSEIIEGISGRLKNKQSQSPEHPAVMASQA
jgi:Holliday junction resolvase-like predicted endonuclease